VVFSNDAITSVSEKYDSVNERTQERILARSANNEIAKCP